MALIPVLAQELSPHQAAEERPPAEVRDTDDTLEHDPENASEEAACPPGTLSDAGVCVPVPPREGVKARPQRRTSPP